ncbi:hypothetical protein [Sphingobium nicotianae]|uniref:Uncharacterized protein n=1 Tax=Sphingobium nicotianae TaxID=2782607 RepID=A0A9X1DBR0_9SPHN|nr:hypothetical protein [Sphingobium nicotianae]MBT2187135.1 hypothetical protein [Sphingobium nicotianae]
MKRGTLAGFVDDTLVFGVLAWLLSEFHDHGLNPRFWDYAPRLMLQWLLVGLVFSGAVNLSVHLRKPAA